MNVSNGSRILFLPVLELTVRPVSHTSPFHPQSTCAQWEFDVAVSTCTVEHAATDIIQSHIMALLVYVIWA